MTSRSRRRLPPSWRLSIAGLAGVAISFGFARYGYGLFLPEIRAEFGLSMAAAGMISSAVYAGYLGALLLVGVYATRMGPRRLVAIGGGSAVIGTALVGIAPNVETLAAGLILAGTSAGWMWAPYSDAADQMLPARQRHQVLSVIAAGTAFGVVVTGPLAIVADGQTWRPAWIVFSLGSLAATVYNLRILPPGPARVTDRGAASTPLSIGWFLQPGAVRLYVTALSYGVIGSVYWLLAVEAVSAGSGLGRHTAAVFWTVTGAAGVVGVMSGAMFARLGLRVAHVVLFASLAVAVALLGVAPGSLPAVLASALIYGPVFMAVSALLAVWSYQLFPSRPTTGFSACLVLLGLGTVIAPAVVGVVVERTDVRTAFLLTAVVAGLTFAARPGTAREERDASPQPT